MKKLIDWLKNNSHETALIAVFILMVGIIAMWLLYLNSLKQVKDQQATIGQMLIDNQDFTSSRAKDSGTIYQQQQLILTQSQVIEKLKLDTQALNLKNIQSAVKIQQLVYLTKIKTTPNTKPVVVSGRDSINANDSDYILLPSGYKGYVDSMLAKEYQDSYLKLPQSYHYISNWSHINMTLDQYANLTLDSGVIYNNQSIVIADKKMGFLKAPKPIVQITNSNPDFRIVTFENGNIQYKNPFYKRPVVWFIFGAIAGGFAVSQF